MPLFEFSDGSSKQSLRKEVSRAADAYYNGNPIMSDREFDAKLDALSSADPEAADAVGAPVKGKLPKVQHKYPAKSLDKTKDPNHLVEVMSEAGTPLDPVKDIVLMWKLDGCTLQLTYESGNLVQAATRGDGKVGQSVLHNIPAIAGIPDSLMGENVDLVVRGEVIMPYAEFERVNESIDEELKYKNPRNLASASLSALDVEDIMDRGLVFKAFEIVHSSNPRDGIDVPIPMSAGFSILESFGFGVVDHVVVDPSTLGMSLELWSSKADGYGIPVDGLVVALNDREYARGFEGTAHHPHPFMGYALKWKDEEADTTLRSIEWSLSRTSLLNPVAVFDPVDLEGTTVTRASLHNFSIMRGMHLRVGDTISVYKANKIIPQVSSNKTDGSEYGESEFESMDVRCPVCGAKAALNVTKDGVETALCPNLACHGKVVQKLAHYASRSGMDMVGISEQTIERLVRRGYLYSFSDFYKLNRFKDDICSMPGFGDKSYDLLWSAIERSKNTTLTKFIAAIGMPGVGKSQSEDVAAMFDGDAQSMINGLADADLSDIDGFGDVMNESIHKWWSNDGVKSEVSEAASYLTFDKPKVPSLSSDRLGGASFCVTGKLEHHSSRSEIQAVISQNGGKAVSSVTKKTDYLISNDIGSTSSKMAKARQLGIKVITESQFLDMVG